MTQTDRTSSLCSMFQSFCFRQKKGPIKNCFHCSHIAPIKSVLQERVKRMQKYAAELQTFDSGNSSFYKPAIHVTHDATWWDFSVCHYAKVAHWRAISRNHTSLENLWELWSLCVRWSQAAIISMLTNPFTCFFGSVVAFCFLLSTWRSAAKLSSPSRRLFW